MLLNYKQWLRPGSNKTSDSETSPPWGETSSPLKGLVLFKSIIRRQFAIILLAAVSVNFFGLIYLFSAPSKYTATTTVLIDTRKGLLPQQSVFGDATTDSAMVETQVEILKSEKIGLAVIATLQLAEDREFAGPGDGLIEKVASYLIGQEKPTSNFVVTRQALEKFADRTTIRRIGLTYMIEISFTSLEAEKSARIANAIADSYIAYQLEAKDQAAQRATKWLHDQVTELSRQAARAGRAVVEFKENNQIVDSGASAYRLLSAQQLAEISSQLTIARTATAAARARLEGIQEVLQQEIPDESVTDALKNDVINRLRSQYVDLKMREAMLSGKYGKDHLAVVNIGIQMQEIRRSIADELRRISERTKSDYDIAKAQEENVKNDLASILSEVRSSDRAQIQLRELESGAQAYRSVYDNLLQRYAETIQQQSVPIMDVRVVSSASPPLKRSHPKTLIILSVTLATSLMLGLGIALYREA